MGEWSHRDRIAAILKGETPDRYAASFWRHFFHLESTAEGLADAMVGFQERYDWDFMKINPRADYHIEDWGFRHEFSTDEFSKHRKTAFPIQGIEDWAKISPLPLTSPSLAEHLKAISLIRRRVGDDLPILMTVFTPLAIAGRMVPDRQILADHLRSQPQMVVPALRAITATFTAFAAEVRNAGADGLFYATTAWASEDMLTWNEYQTFALPFDLEVIAGTGGGALNLFHVCGSNNYVKKLAGYNFHSSLYNWDDADPTNATLEQGQKILPGKTLVGGVDYRGWLVRSDASEMSYLVDKVKSQHKPSTLIIGPGCAIDPRTPAANLKAIRERL